ncbi:hypothetical protein ABPG73_013219 [Tetrahymena malaccensis]
MEKTVTEDDLISYFHQKKEYFSTMDERGVIRFKKPIQMISQKEDDIDVDDISLALIKTSFIELIRSELRNLGYEDIRLVKGNSTERFIFLAIITKNKNRVIIKAILRTDAQVSDYGIQRYGNQLYRAPECFQQSQNQVCKVTRKSESYSFGLLLYRMVSSEEAIEQAYQERNQQINPIDSFSMDESIQQNTEFINLLKSLCDPNPDQRIFVSEAYEILNQMFVQQNLNKFSKTLNGNCTEIALKYKDQLYICPVNSRNFIPIVINESEFIKQLEHKPIEQVAKISDDIQQVEGKSSSLIKEENQIEKNNDHQLNNLNDLDRVESDNFIKNHQDYSQEIQQTSKLIDQQNLSKSCYNFFQQSKIKNVSSQEKNSQNLALYQQNSKSKNNQLKNEQNIQKFEFKLNKYQQSKESLNIDQTDDNQESKNQKIERAVGEENINDPFLKKSQIIEQKPTILINEENQIKKSHDHQLNNLNGQDRADNFIKNHQGDYKELKQTSKLIDQQNLSKSCYNFFQQSRIKNFSSQEENSQNLAHYLHNSESKNDQIKNEQNIQKFEFKLKKYQQSKESLNIDQTEDNQEPKNQKIERAVGEYNINDHFKKNSQIIEQKPTILINEENQIEKNNGDQLNNSNDLDRADNCIKNHQGDSLELQQTSKLIAQQNFSKTCYNFFQQSKIKNVSSQEENSENLVLYQQNSLNESNNSQLKNEKNIQKFLNKSQQSKERLNIYQTDDNQEPKEQKIDREVGEENISDPFKKESKIIKQKPTILINGENQIEKNNSDQLNKSNDLDRADNFIKNHQGDNLELQQTSNLIVQQNFSKTCYNIFQQSKIKNVSSQEENSQNLALYQQNILNEQKSNQLKNEQNIQKFKNKYQQGKERLNIHQNDDNQEPKDQKIDRAVGEENINDPFKKKSEIIEQKPIIYQRYNKSTCNIYQNMNESIDKNNIMKQSNLLQNNNNIFQKEMIKSVESVKSQTGCNFHRTNIQKIRKSKDMQNQKKKDDNDKFQQDHLKEDLIQDLYNPKYFNKNVLTPIKYSQKQKDSFLQKINSLFKLIGIYINFTDFNKQIQFDWNKKSNDFWGYSVINEFSNIPESKQQIKNQYQGEYYFLRTNQNEPFTYYFPEKAEGNISLEQFPYAKFDQAKFLGVSMVIQQIYDFFGIKKNIEIIDREEEKIKQALFKLIQSRDCPLNSE